MTPKLEVDRVQQQQQQQQQEQLKTPREQNPLRSRRGNEVRQSRQDGRRAEQRSEVRAEQLEQVAIARQLQTTRTSQLRSAQAVAVSKLRLYNAGALDRLTDIAATRGERVLPSTTQAASMQDRGTPRKPRVDLSVGEIQQPGIARNVPAPQPARQMRKFLWLSEMQEKEYEELMQLAGAGAEVMELVEGLFQNGYSQVELVAICKALGIDTGGLGETGSLMRLGADLGAAAREPGGYIMYTPSDIRDLIDKTKAA